MKTPKIALLITVVVALLLTSVMIVAAQDTTELAVTWWGSQNRHDRTIEVINMFEAEHPDIHVTYEFVGWSDYWTKVNTQVAGGNVACVMQQDYKFMTEWATRGLLTPLDDLIASGAIDASDIATVGARQRQGQRADLRHQPRHQLAGDHHRRRRLRQSGRRPARVGLDVG